MKRQGLRIAKLPPEKKQSLLNIKSRKNFIKVCFQVHDVYFCGHCSKVLKMFPVKMGIFLSRKRFILCGR